MEGRHFARKSDLVSLGVIVTLCGAVWAGIKVPMRWEQTSKDVELMKVRIENNEKSIEETKTITKEADVRNSVQFQMILRELDGIHKELKGWKNQGYIVPSVGKG